MNPVLYSINIYIISIKMGFSDNDGQPGNFAEQYATRRESHLTALQQKEEEMRQKFVIRVKEKESELKEAEREVINSPIVCKTVNTIKI